MTSTTLPYQRNNAAILLGLLAAMPAEKYDHTLFGFGYETHSDPDVGCALGLAMKNREMFTVIETQTVPDSERSLFQRLFGLNKTREVSRVPELDPEKEGFMAPWYFAREVFGYDAESRLFCYTSFSSDGTSERDVTKDMVAGRLAAFA